MELLVLLIHTVMKQVFTLKHSTVYHSKELLGLEQQLTLLRYGLRFGIRLQLIIQRFLLVPNLMLPELRPHTMTASLEPSQRHIFHLVHGQKIMQKRGPRPMIENMLLDIHLSGLKIMTKTMIRFGIKIGPRVGM